MMSFARVMICHISPGWYILNFSLENFFCTLCYTGNPNNNVIILEVGTIPINQPFNF